MLKGHAVMGMLVAGLGPGSCCAAPAACVFCLEGLSV
jgi:hypothetical protein